MGVTQLEAQTGKERRKWREERGGRAWMPASASELAAAVEGRWFGCGGGAPLSSPREATERDEQSDAFDINNWFSQYQIGS